MEPEKDFEGIDFGDKRLNKRLIQMVENSRKNAGGSILSSEKGRSSAKGFYRLLGNPKFDMKQMREGAKKGTISRMSGTVLFIQDTTDISLNGHKKTEGLGYSCEQTRGIKLHSCIAMSPEGIAYGLVSQYYETREGGKSKLTKAEKKKLPIEEKESYRWLSMLQESTRELPDGVRAVTICDREGDFYELYAKAKELGKDFVIRVTHDRKSEGNERTARKIREKEAMGKVIVNIPRDTRRGIPARQTEMEVACCKVVIGKPENVRDGNVAPKLAMNLVRITEITPPAGQEPIEWIIATTLPIDTASEVMTIVEYYIQRWKIERFHYVLKSGCGAEKIQQRTYERMKPVLLIYSMIALYIMAVTYMGRVLPDMPCDVFFDDDEWKILYRMVHKGKAPPDKPFPMADAIKYLGELGSYKRAPSDGPPGLKSIWKGLFLLFRSLDLFMGQV